MTRHYYIECRKNGLHGNILYKYYQEEALNKGLSLLLRTPHQFMTAYRMWPLGEIVLQSLLSKLDIEFEVTKLEDKNGKVIKYI